MNVLPKHSQDTSCVEDSSVQFINIPAKQRLIVALDFDSADKAIELVDELGDEVEFYKVGWRLFINEGIRFVSKLTAMHKKVFLDLKIGDIEETIRSTLSNLQDKDKIELLTIHGNGATVEAAKNGRNGNDKPLLLMLTALSSQDDYDIKDVLASDNVNREGYVIAKAQRSLDAGCEGLIASGKSVKKLRMQFPNHKFLIVAPGIRPKGTAPDDHKNVLTPYQAISDGADYLVVGRPISTAHNRKEVACSIIADIEKALNESIRQTQ